MNTAVDTDDGNPVLRKLVFDAIEDWKTRLSAIVQEGVRRREIRRSIEPCRIATTIIATLEGALVISRLEGSKTALRDAQQSLEDLLREIACPAARKNQRARLRAEQKSQPASHAAPLPVQ